MSYSAPWERARPVHRPPATRPATPSGDPDEPDRPDDAATTVPAQRKEPDRPRDRTTAAGPAPRDRTTAERAARDGTGRPDLTDRRQGAPARPEPTHRARKRERDADLLVPPGTPLRARPVPGLGDDGWRSTAETVDRLLDGDRARLRAALDRRSEERLRAAVPLARTLLDDVVGILADVERRTARPGAGTAAAVPPSGTLRIARDFPWPELLQRYGRTNDAGCVAAARTLQEALAELRPDEIAEAPVLLRRDLRRLRRALRRADRTDRPLSAARLRALLTAVVRVVETVAIGLLAAAATAIQRGDGVATAVFTAGVGLAVSASCEQAAKLVREHRTPPSPAARLAAAHEDLDLAVGDLRQLLAEGGDPGLVGDTRAAALALAHHARRLAGAVTWSRADAYVASIDALVPALAPTADPAALAAAAEAVGTVRLPAARPAGGRA